MSFVKNAAVVISSLTLMMSTVTTVGAASAAVTKTGQNSVNKITVSNYVSTQVYQSNTSSVKNSINIGTNTGGNKANKNTGSGDVTSGDVNIGVIVKNGGNTNAAIVDDPCECLETDEEAVIRNTGADSINKVEFSTKTKKSTAQKNVSWVGNWLDLFTNTGDNQASKNTEDGTVESGTVDLGVKVVNQADTNILE